MSLLRVLFGLAIIFLSLVMSNGENYCSVCRDHTRCKPFYKKPACPTRSYGITPQLKTLLLNEHNKYRQRVASGHEKRGKPGPQPRAKYMPNLVWDNEIAMIAQTLANSCKYGHDDCRNVKRFQVGQNIAQVTMNNNQLAKTIKFLVQLWYDEVRLFNPRNVNKYKFEKEVGHYTQMVWAGTTKLGCGYVNYKSGNGYKVYLVCNYGPSGNRIGGKIYEIRR